MSNLLFFYVAGRHTAKFSPERVVFRFSYGGHHPAPLYRLFAVTEHVPVVRSVWKTTLKYLTEIRDNFGSKPKKQAFLEIAVSNFSKLDCVRLL